MSKRTKWIVIAVLVLATVIAGWIGSGRLWSWVLALHGH